MDEKKKQRIMIWVAVGVFVALGIIILALLNNGSNVVVDTIVKTTETAKTEQKIAAEDAKAIQNLNLSQSVSVEQKNLPAGTIDLTISLEKGFSPKEFTVKAGEKVALAITAQGDLGHTFSFKDRSIIISLNAGAGATNFASFIAPTKKGEYIFSCNLPGHEENGELGKMIVN